MKLENEGREFEKNLRSLGQFIQTVKGQNYWNNYNSIWKKSLGFRNIQEKLEKVHTAAEKGLWIWGVQNKYIRDPCFLKSSYIEISMKLLTH